MLTLPSEQGQCRDCPRPGGAAGKLAHFTNTNRVLWPEEGYTKGDLIAYYHLVSPWLLPHVAGRPVTLQRYPNGIDAESFFEKNVPRGAPPWVETVTLPSGGRRPEVSYVVCDDESTLLYLANLAAITLHVWTSRVGSLDSPDYVFFGLDPGDGAKAKAKNGAKNGATVRRHRTG